MVVNKDYIITGSMCGKLGRMTVRVGAGSRHRNSGIPLIQKYGDMDAGK